MNLEFFVSRRKLTRKGSGSVVADGTGIDTFTVDFDEEWDGLVKLVELKNADACAQVIYTGKTPLPARICGRGALYLTCYGYRRRGDDVAVLRTAPMVHPVMMAGPSAAQGSSGQPYTPSAFDRMTAEVAQAQQAAEEARAVAAELQKLKENGAFKGEPGAAGAAAAVEILPLRQGTPARVENLGTSNRARLRFTLPYGMTEEEKNAMAEQIRTSLEESIGLALDEILHIQQQCIDRSREGTA